MTQPIAALDFLGSAATSHPPAPVCVVFGSEAYLQRQVVAALRERVLTSDDAELSLRKADGSETELRDVIDELSTIPMFGGGHRLVIVEDADEFVTRYRSELEDYARKPKATGILVLVVSQWASNTRLYKLLAVEGLQIDCGAPKPAAVTKWLNATAQRHGAKLAGGAADELLDIVGADLGMLEQEIAKLALLAGEGGQITPALVQEMVGGWRARTGWEMLDAACDGKQAEALTQLDRLILAGEHPIAILGQVSYTLRMLARATRIYIDAQHQSPRAPNLAQSLIQAGCKPHVVGKVEPRLRRLGRDRGTQIYRWLLESDLAMKGASSAPHRARLVLEKLIVRIAAPDGAKRPSRTPSTAKAG